MKFLQQSAFRALHEGNSEARFIYLDGMPQRPEEEADKLKAQQEALTEIELNMVEKIENLGWNQKIPSVSPVYINGLSEVYMSVVSNQGQDASLGHIDKHVMTLPTRFKGSNARSGREIDEAAILDTYGMSLEDLTSRLNAVAVSRAERSTVLYEEETEPTGIDLSEPDTGEPTGVDLGGGDADEPTGIDLGAGEVLTDDNLHEFIAQIQVPEGVTLLDGIRTSYPPKLAFTTVINGRTEEFYVTLQPGMTVADFEAKIQENLDWFESKDAVNPDPSTYSLDDVAAEMGLEEPAVIDPINPDPSTYDLDDVAAEMGLDEPADTTEAVNEADSRLERFTDLLAKIEEAGGVYRGPEVEDIQKELKEGGFYNGAIDGIAGNGTRGALEKAITAIESSVTPEEIEQFEADGVLVTAKETTFMRRGKEVTATVVDHVQQYFLHEHGVKPAYHEILMVNPQTGETEALPDGPYEKRTQRIDRATGRQVGGPIITRTAEGLRLDQLNEQFARGELVATLRTSTNADKNESLSPRDRFERAKGRVIQDEVLLDGSTAVDVDYPSTDTIKEVIDKLLTQPKVAEFFESQGIDTSDHKAVAPYLYQEIGGTKTPIGDKFLIFCGTEVGIVTEPQDLLIDPQVHYNGQPCGGSVTCPAFVDLAPPSRPRGPNVPTMEPQDPETPDTPGRECRPAVRCGASGKEYNVIQCKALNGNYWSTTQWLNPTGETCSNGDSGDGDGCNGCNATSGADATEGTASGGLG